MQIFKTSKGEEYDIPYGEMVELLNSLHTLGLLTKLYQHNIITPKVRFQYEIYCAVYNDMKVNKSEKSVAVLNVSEKLNIKERTVWRALSKMCQ